MENSKMKKLFYVAVWLVYVSASSAESTYAGALGPKEVLDFYEQSLQPINSRAAFKVESRITFAGAWEPKREPWEIIVAVCRDGDKLSYEFFGDGKDTF